MCDSENWKFTAKFIPYKSYSPTPFSLKEETKAREVTTLENYHTDKTSSEV